MVDVVFPERESKLIEYKSRPPEFEALIKTCVAFANGAGGRIIIGVDDTTHRLTGFSEDDRTKIYDDFPNSLYDSTQPSLEAQIYEQNHGKYSVLIIEIPPSPKKPYFLKSKGVGNGTYIRVGSSTRKATPETIEDLRREAQRIHYDEEIVHVNTDVLSKELLHDYYGASVTKKRLLADKIIAIKPANKDQYCPTVAGVLMFSEIPHHYIPESVIRCARYKGVEGREFLRTEDITGSVEQQAIDSYKTITNWLEIEHELRGVKLKGQLPIPSIALREVIINALLHRKYSIPGSVKISVYDDRIEIFSPGGFPGVVDINNLGDGTTYLRNPSLVRLAYQKKLVETRGTGIRSIFESCRKAGIRKPEYQEDGDFVKAILYFEPNVSSYHSESDAIVAYIKLERKVTANQVSNYLSVSHNTAIRKLNELIKTGRINKVGVGPATKYCLKDTI